jgi:hypothetical protein
MTITKLMRFPAHENFSPYHQPMAHPISPLIHYPFISPSLSPLVIIHRSTPSLCRCTLIRLSCSTGPPRPLRSRYGVFDSAGAAPAHHHPCAYADGGG